MSIKLMSQIFDRYPNGGGEMLLALAIADHAHDDGTHIYPSVSTLAKKTRQSERTVQYQLRKMQECGWLVLVKQASGKPGQTNQYSINSKWVTGANDDGCNFCTGANDDIDGCNPQQRRVQNKAKTGAITVAPEPLPKPSYKPSEEPSVIPPAAASEPPEPLRVVPKSSKSKPLTAADLINRFSVNPEVAADWLAVRKAKHAPLTETAMAGIEREAHAAGMAVCDAIRVCAEQSWQGFKADWYRNLRGTRPPENRDTGEDIAARNRRAVQEAKVILFGAQA